MTGHDDERFRLYRAKAQTGRETSPVRLRELEHARDAALERLATARRAAQAGAQEPVDPT
jgi:hypothetical protein